MELLEHPLLVVYWVNTLLGPVVTPLLGMLGFHPHADDPYHGPIPPHIVMGLLIILLYTVLGLILRSRLSVDKPSRFQIIVEDIVSALVGLLEEWIGPSGRKFLPLIGALGVFILTGNYFGLMPGLMAPTSNINTTLGCALTIWVYYHLQGVMAQGLVPYVLHFAGGPDIPWWMKPVMFVLEIISHLSRVLSLTLRLFGNVFGEELIIIILGVLLPLLLPVPMMALGLVTGLLQAFIFVLLSVIYLQGAVHVAHHDEHHAEAHGAAGASGGQAHAHAAA